MNTKSLALTQTFIWSAPWFVAKMHLDADKDMEILVTDLEYGLFQTVSSHVLAVSCGDWLARLPSLLQL